MLPANQENFQIWRECRLLLLLIYKITELFPQNTTICLKDQLQDNCVEILANIVRSMRRYPNQLNLDDLEISIKSLHELEKCLKKAYKYHMLKISEFNQLKNKTDIIHASLLYFMERRAQKIINN